MKPRYLTVLLLCLVVVLAGTVARADVIWEPSDDFYMKKYEDCDSLGRRFLANGAEGSVSVRKEPGSPKVAATVENGSKFFVSFTYTDKKGEQWGVVQFGYDENGKVKEDYSLGEYTGWIPLRDLALIYDYISFDEEHKSEFKPYEGDYAALMSAGEIVVWSYPGSGVVTQKLKEIDENFSFSHTYEDPEGRLWGYITYYYGSRNCWVCITDPTNDALPTAAVETVTLITPLPSQASTASPANTPLPANTEPARVPEQNELSIAVLLLILVALLVIVTAILIRVFWKKK